MTAHSHKLAPALTSVFRGAAITGRRLGGALGIITMQIILVLPSPASAAIFKCVNAAGDTTYTSTPCAHDESTRRISRSATAVAGLDCRIARKLAFDTSRRMKTGESSGRVFDSHGGMDSLSPLVLGMISYIYTFEGNKAISASRIATLATERCQVGSFGSNARHCETYPHEFVQQLGGCEAARDEPAGTVNTSAPGGADTAPSAEPVVGAATPASYAPPASAPNNDAAAVNAAARADNERASCRERISQTLENNNLRMNDGVSATEQDRLRALQRQLRMQIARC